MEWPLEITDLLISEVEKKQCIWNPRDENFRDRYVRKDVWNIIAGVIGKSPLECSSKWNKLKSQYSRERRKKNSLKRSVDGEDDCFVLRPPKWVYFNKMNFLSNIVRPVEMKHKTSMDDDDNDEDDEDDYDDEFAISLAMPVMKEQDLERDEVEHFSRASSTDKTEEILPERATKRKRLFQQDSTNKTALDIMLQTSAAMKAQDETRKSKDEHDVFSCYVATELRTISDPIAVLKLKKKIQDVIFESKLSWLQSQAQSEIKHQASSSGT